MNEIRDMLKYSFKIADPWYPSENEEFVDSIKKEVKETLEKRSSIFENISYKEKGYFPLSEVVYNILDQNKDFKLMNTTLHLSVNEIFYARLEIDDFYRKNHFYLSIPKAWLTLECMTPPKDLGSLSEEVKTYLFEKRQEELYKVVKDVVAICTMAYTDALESGTKVLKLEKNSDETYSLRVKASKELIAQAVFEDTVSKGNRELREVLHVGDGPNKIIPILLGAKPNTAVMKGLLRNTALGNIKEGEYFDSKGFASEVCRGEMQISLKQGWLANTFTSDFLPKIGALIDPTEHQEYPSLDIKIDSWTDKLKIYGDLRTHRDGVRVNLSLELESEEDFSVPKKPKAMDQELFEAWRAISDFSYIRRASSVGLSLFNIRQGQLREYQD